MNYSQAYQNYCVAFWWYILVFKIYLVVASTCLTGMGLIVYQTKYDEFPLKYVPYTVGIIIGILAFTFIPQP